MMNNDGDGDSHGGGDDVVCVADVADVAKPVGLLTFQGSVIYSFLVTLILLHLHLFHYVFTYCVYMYMPLDVKPLYPRPPQTPIPTTGTPHPKPKSGSSQRLQYPVIEGIYLESYEGSSYSLRYTPYNTL